MHLRVIARTGHCEQSLQLKIENIELKRDISAQVTIGGLITKLKLAAKACPPGSDLYAQNKKQFDGNQ